MNDQELEYIIIKKKYNIYKKLILVIAVVIALFFLEAFVLKSPMIYQNLTTWTMLLLYFYSMFLKSKYIKMINILIKNDHAQYGKNNVIVRKLSSFKFDDNATVNNFVKHMKN